MTMTRRASLGTLPSGPHNAITDVPGVRVGHATILRDQPVFLRTGVTIIHPLAAPSWEENVFAGFHRYNGFGEVAGTQWLAETGILTAPVALTSTFNLGAVRDAILRYTTARSSRRRFQIPVVAETNDFFLSDTPAWTIGADDVIAAIEGAAGGPVPEGNVGGGTGNVGYLFKAGIGTASKKAKTPSGEYTVGVLVQSNHGRREDFCYGGLPVGRVLGADVVPFPKIVGDDPYLIAPAFAAAAEKKYKEDGSVIIVIATDAPLTAHQCRRLAQRAVVGLGRTGGLGNNSSGDFCLCFSTGNRLPQGAAKTIGGLAMIPNEHTTPLFQATVEATESALVNSVLMAETMIGRRGNTAWALSPEVLAQALPKAADLVLRQS
jgi:D-aminopeptidase